MGSCAGTDANKKRPSAPSAQTNVGMLEARIVHYISRDQNMRDVSIEDLKIKIWISNQLYTYSLADILDKDKKKPTLKFYINSRMKEFGRSINFQIWNNKKLSISTIPYGIYDLNQLIEDVADSDEGESVNQLTAEVHMNCLERQAGSLFVDLYFTKIPYDNIKFHIEQVQIDKLVKPVKPKIHSYSLKFIVGQQVYETPVVQSSSNKIRFDIDTINFMVPRNLKNATISVIEKKGKTDFLIASTKIQLKSLTNSAADMSSMKEILNPQNHIDSCSLTYMCFSDRHLIVSDPESEVGDDVMPEPNKRLSKKTSTHDRITSIKLIGEEEGFRHSDPIKEVEELETNDIEGRESIRKIELIPPKEFSGIRLNRIENSGTQDKNSSSDKQKEMDPRKSGNEETRRSSRRNSRGQSIGKAIRLGSLPPKNIQEAMLQLAANKKITQQL